MNEVILKENIKIENLIYEIRGVQVMLDSEILRTKYHNHIYYEMIIHYNIVNQYR